MRAEIEQHMTTSKAVPLVLLVVQARSRQYPSAASVLQPHLLPRHHALHVRSQPRPRPFQPLVTTPACAALLSAQGGPGTLATVLATAKLGCPIVILSNSGGAATAIWRFCEHGGLDPDRDTAFEKKRDMLDEIKALQARCVWGGGDEAWGWWGGALTPRIVAWEACRSSLLAA